MQSVFTKTRLISLALLVLLGVTGVSYYIFVQKPAQDFAATNAPVTLTRPEAGLEFTYIEGPDAFSLFEPSALAEPLHSVFMLIPSPQFVALRNQEQIDTPPSITLFVYNKRNAYDRPDETSGEDLSRRDRLVRWATENDALTSFSRAETVTDITVDDVNGISYQTDGAFPQTIYLISYQDRIYFFVGQYETEGDYLQEAFTELLSTIYFI